MAYLIIRTDVEVTYGAMLCAQAFCLNFTEEVDLKLGASLVLIMQVFVMCCHLREVLVKLTIAEKVCSR